MIHIRKNVISGQSNGCYPVHSVPLYADSIPPLVEQV